MKAKFFAAALVASVLFVPFVVSAETISTVVDYVDLNGGISSNLVVDTRRTDITYEYDPENAVWMTRRLNGTGNALISDSTIVDFEGKTGVLKITSGGCGVGGTWQGPCVQYAFDSGVALKEAQTVKIPYYCDAKGLQGSKLRIVALAGSNSFSVDANETIVTGAWTTAVFELSTAFAELAANYAGSKDSNITRLRIYGGGFYNPSYSSADITVTSFDFPSGKSMYFGSVTYEYEKITSLTASFDANGGEPIADIVSDENLKVTLPTPVREGFTCLGWYQSNGQPTAPGTTVDLVANTTFVAGWRRIDPSVALTPGDRPYKRVLNLHTAYGNTYDVIVGYDRGYYPLEDRTRSTISATVVITAPVENGVTNIQAAISNCGSSWVAPYVQLRFPALTLADIYEVRIPYSYVGTSSNVIDKPLVFYYKIGSTWRHLEGDTTLVASENGEYHTIKVKVGKALGEDFESLKDSAIADMKFYFYGGTANDSGFKSTAWSANGTFVFCPITFVSYPLPGLAILVR